MELKTDPWFKNFSWDKLLKKQINPTFIPNSKNDNFDHKFVNMEDDDDIEDLKQNEIMLRRDSV